MIAILAARPPDARRHPEAAMPSNVEAKVSSFTSPHLRKMQIPAVGSHLVVTVPAPKTLLVRLNRPEQLNCSFALPSRSPHLRLQRWTTRWRRTSSACWTGRRRSPPSGSS